MSIGFYICTTMNTKTKKALTFILSVSLGCVFIFSAYTKTQPIAFFEITIQEQLGFSQVLAGILARFFIGLECGLGLLMLMNVSGKKKWVIKTGIGLLVMFTIHLIILLFSKGNDSNCGCMGNVVPMTPGVSILKNIGLLILFGLLHYTARGDRDDKNNKLSILTLVGVIALPFILYNRNFKEISLDPVYDMAVTAPTPQVDLRKGKYFLGMLSMTCTHCRDAAKELHQFKVDNPSLPIYIIYLAPPEEFKKDIMEDFFKETKADNIPYTFMEQKEFIEIAGTNVPAMYWIKNGRIEQKVKNGQIHIDMFTSWINVN